MADQIDVCSIGISILYVDDTKAQRVGGVGISILSRDDTKAQRVGGLGLSVLYSIDFSPSASPSLSPSASPSSSPSSSLSPSLSPSASPSSSISSSPSPSLSPSASPSVPPLANWPTTLPIYPQDGTFTETLPKTIRIVQTDIGPPKVRCVSTSAPSMVTGDYILTNTQLQAFRTFYVDTLHEGQDEFMWPHPRTETNVTAFFTKVPTYSSQGYDLFKLQIELGVENT